MVSSWEFPKTFYLTIPDHGAASVYFEKIVPPPHRLSAQHTAEEIEGR
jgi:hypothetical protein